MINKDTKLFVSVSSHPGNFGATLYNTAFQEINYNAVYKPLKINSVYDIPKLLENAPMFGVQGISVSMPWKKAITDFHGFFNFYSEEVKQTRNTNTLVLDSDNKWLGYNTDIVGFEKSNQEALKSARSATIVGRGAVSESVRYVLDKYGVRYVIVSSRKDIEVKSDWLINCSCVGMDHIPDNIFTENVVSQFQYVFDVVVSNKPTNLIKLAQKLKKNYVQGWEMSLEQLCKQFELYANTNAPRSIFRRVLKEKGYDY